MRAPSLWKTSPIAPNSPHLSPDGHSPIYLAALGLSYSRRDLQLQHVGSSSPTRGQTWAPALGAWSPSHRTTKKFPNAYSCFELRFTSCRKCSVTPLLITTTITHTHTHTPLSVVGPGRLQWTFSEFLFPASLKAVEGQPLGSRLILSEHRNIFKEGGMKKDS